MLITTDDELAFRIDHWRQRPWLTVDTEFVREDTYYPKLALIQIGDGANADCIDIPALTDTDTLCALFDASDILKIFHSPDQDLEIFVHRWGRCPAPLFDTQLAATLLGIADQPGYAALVQAMLGITLDKDLTRTPWLRRPLSAAEIAYAAADVEHLATIYPLLEARLREAGRLSWHAEDCLRMGMPVRYQPDPEREWQRLKGLGRLDTRAQHIAARLAAWREGIAMKSDRPRKWILSDEALFAIATRRPQTTGQLESLNAMSPRQVQRHADGLLACVQAGSRVEAPPLVAAPGGDARLRARLATLQQTLRGLAAHAGLPTALLASRAHLEAIAREGAEARVPALGGWRRAIVGEALLAVV